MKTMISLFVLTASSAATLCAQNSRPITAEIPFAFFVGDRQMPAGEYRVTETSAKMIIVRSEDCRGAAVLQSFAARKMEPKKRDTLVFRSYGEGRYFLGWIWCAGSATGTEVPKSEKEREAVTSTLVSSTRPTTVVILARLR